MEPSKTLRTNLFVPLAFVSVSAEEPSLSFDLGFWLVYTERVLYHFEGEEAAD